MELPVLRRPFLSFSIQLLRGASGGGFSKGFSAESLIDSALGAMDSVANSVLTTGADLGEAGSAVDGSATGALSTGFFLKNENMETFYNHLIL